MNKNKEELVKEYLDTIVNRLSVEYGLSFEAAYRAVEDLDLLSSYKDDYYFLLHEDISTWVDIALDRYNKLKFSKPLFLTPTLKQAMESVEPKEVEPNNRLEEGKEALKEFKSMENYIVINGKKAELTEEHLKQLGIKVEEKRNNPFKIEHEDKYYYIRDYGTIDEDVYMEGYGDDEYINNINCFNDKEFANQVYLKELLNRKLLKYAWDNEAEDCGDWDNNFSHYYIYLDKKSCNFAIDGNIRMQSQSVYFSKKDVARQAIKDIVEPFMKEHPDFRW